MRAVQEFERTEEDDVVGADIGVYQSFEHKHSASELTSDIQVVYATQVVPSSNPDVLVVDSQESGVLVYNKARHHIGK